MAKKKSEINPIVPVNPPHEMDAILADGQSLLTPADEIPIPVKPIVIDEKNIYQRAKKVMYDAMPQWRRIELDKMFERKDLDNRHYSQFIKDLNVKAQWIEADDLEKEQKKSTGLKK